MKLIIVSNRLPYHIDPESLELKKGSGGLATALSSLNGSDSFSEIQWVGCICGSENHKIWRENHYKFPSLKNVYPVFIGEDDYDTYYNKVANSILWPLCHYEHYDESSLLENWNTYKKINLQVAEIVNRLADEDSFIWIHDYHFFLMPQMIRQMQPKVRVGFFLHIPFPSSEIFRTLPKREEVLHGLLGADLVGFHDYSYLRHFQQSLSTLCGIDSNLLFAKSKDGRKVSMGVFPATIESKEIQNQASNLIGGGFKVENFIAKKKGTKLILGVDRLDYSKGIDLKLKAFRLFLIKHPEMIGKVSLLQLAIPTRHDIQKYQDLKQHVEQLVGEINGEFGDPSYVPIRYMYSTVNHKELLCLYRNSEALLVTAKRDGLNLVALEYVSAQDKMNPGVAIVSEFAGASSILSHCIPINPWNLDHTASTIKKSLELSLKDRIERHEASLAFLGKYDTHTWASAFLKKLKLSSSPRQDKFEAINLAGSSDHSNLWRALLEKNKTIRLFIDFDGTLAPIQDSPSKVILDPSTRSILKTLSQVSQLKLTIISGRNQDFLEDRFKGLNLSLVAEHGAIKKPASEASWTYRTQKQQETDWYQASLKIMKDYEVRVPDSFIELKDYALVWHYRKSPKQFARFQALKLKEELELGLANQPVSVKLGKSIIEAKSIAANKGQYIAEELSEIKNSNDIFIAIGDDETDEDMFKSIGKDHISIKVGQEPTNAKYFLADQSEVSHLFQELIVACQQSTKNIQY